MLQDMVETAKSHIRSKLEHAFRAFKQQFAFQKTRLSGLAKNRCKITGSVDEFVSAPGQLLEIAWA
jgi:IS5 family transposase